MGKASQWMLKFLLGKKKKETVSIQEKPAPSPLKRRWSFGKTTRKNNSVQTRSFSTDNPIPSTEATTTRFPVIPWRGQAVQDAAATRIQAAFRSYLARKALRALRGLVKLQALVRGHQVRKRMEATLRSMHALMSIQVRARIQRIQMVEESETQISIKSQSSRHKGFSRDKESGKIARREIIVVNSNKKSASFRNKNSYMSYKENERTKQRSRACHNGDLSFLKRDHRLEEFLNTAESSPLSSKAGPGAASGRASLNCQPQENPNYMVNTESSKAKVRSQSEPRQRHRWSIKGKGNSTRTASINELNDSTAGSGKLSIESQDTWILNLY